MTLASKIVVESEISARRTRAGTMIFVVAPNQSTAGHEHKSEEIWLVQSGYGEVEINGERKQINDSAPVKIPSNQFHKVFNIGSEELVILSFWWRADD